MPVIEFNHRVKYGGVFYAPHAPVVALKEHIEELIKLGAKVLSQDEETIEKPLQQLEKKPVRKQPYKIPPPSKKEK